MQASIAFADDARTGLTVLVSKKQTTMTAHLVCKPDIDEFISLTFPELSPIDLQPQPSRTLPRQHHLQKALPSQTPHLPHEIIPTHPPPIHRLLQHVHRLSTRRLLRTERPELIRDHRRCDQYLINRRRRFGLRSRDRTIAVLDTAAENGFISRQGLVKLLQLTDLGFEAFVCGAEGVLLCL